MKLKAIDSSIDTKYESNSIKSEINKIILQFDNQESPYLFELG